MKMLVIILALMVELYAGNQNGFIVGQWKAVHQTNNNGTVTTEKKYLNLNANNTFSILLLVTVVKGDTFVRDLQIKGFGIWKLNKDTLVYVVKTVDVPFAKEVYGISQASLTQIAKHFKHRFDSQPIRIFHVKNMNANALHIVSENGFETHYQR